MYWVRTYVGRDAVRVLVTCTCGCGRHRCTCHGPGEVRNLPSRGTSLDMPSHPPLAQDVSRRPCFCSGCAPCELGAVTGDIAVGLTCSSVSRAAMAARWASVTPSHGAQGACRVPSTWGSQAGPWPPVCQRVAGAPTVFEGVPH